MFEIRFEDCGIAQPDGSEVGSFDGVAYLEEDSGMPLIRSIDLKWHFPGKPIGECFALIRLERHVMFMRSPMFDGLCVSIKRVHEREILEKMLDEREERRGPVPYTYQSTISAGRTL